MASVNFYLKNPKEQKAESLIYLFFSFDGKRLKYSTGEKVAPKYWNDRKQRVKSSLTGSTEINTYLNNLGEVALKIYRGHKAKGESPSTTLVKKELSEAFRNPSNSKGMTFFEVFDLFVESTKSKVKHGTTQKYLALKAHLDDFQKKTRFPLDFDTLDAAFYDKLVHFFTEDKGVLNNTVGKYVSTLKTFLHWATDREYNKKEDFKKFKAVKLEADIVCLELEELMSLFNLDLSENERLERVRDTFCLGCFTDFASLTLKNSSRNTSKTIQLSSTPLRPRRRF